jgi:predicted DNA-binding transcriptional regulator YafY
VDKKVAPHLKYERDYFGFVSETEKGKEVEMHFMVPENDQGFPRWFLMFADHAQILEPESMKKRVEKILGEVLRKLQA